MDRAKDSIPECIKDTPTGKYPCPGDAQRQKRLSLSVVGWGLNTIEDAERAFAACHACLREGGHFLIGWNDLPEHRPFRLAEVPSLRKFQPLVFPPLEANEYLIDNEWRHTYSFFYK